MKTEKDIFGKALHHNMNKEDKPKFDLPKRDGSPSLNHRDFFVNTKTGKPYFDAYIGFLLKRKEEVESEDTSRIDEFLKKKVGLNYEEFVNYSKPEEIVEDSYGLFRRKSIRRSLFKFRSRVYLEALCDLDERGEDIQLVLDDIRTEYVPTLKKHEGKEPTFEAIYAALKKVIN
ncbi:hypothetical protein FJZ18_02685 [Candidatus Pacearchaeota archaeon]|nr:hypothetical protein [Candidatus Pacearchaeota archaeon]